MTDNLANRLERYIDLASVGGSINVLSRIETDDNYVTVLRSAGGVFVIYKNRKGIFAFDGDNCFRMVQLREFVSFRDVKLPINDVGFWHHYTRAAEQKGSLVASYPSGIPAESVIPFITSAKLVI